MPPYRILKRLRLGPQHVATGFTRHFRDGALLPAPVALLITQYRVDQGYYLFYCDESGEEQTDTYHDTLAQAMRQAEVEFGVKPEEWDNAEAAG